MYVAPLLTYNVNNILHTATYFEQQRNRELMVNFRMICPDCGAVVIAASPQALVWELCPGCGSHIWDLSDVLMADVFAPDTYPVVAGDRLQADYM